MSNRRGLRAWKIPFRGWKARGKNKKRDFRIKEKNLEDEKGKP